MFDFFKLGKKTSKAKILVVDDEPNIVQVLKDRLEVEEYVVVTACNGDEGLKIARQELPDLILLDVIMPIMDGHEMLEKLRQQDWSTDISVIVLTARSQTQDILRAKDCTIDDYIIKPFDQSELLEKIEHILERRKSLVSTRY